MTAIRKRAILGIKTGDVFTVRRTFTEADMIKFAGITKDYNPVHFEDAFAHSKRFSSRICHGLLAAGLITEIGGQIGWLATGMHFEFKKPVYFNDTVTCRFTVREVNENRRVTAMADYRNQRGETVIKAVITGLLPNKQEREIMARMVAKGDPTNGVMRDG